MKDKTEKDILALQRQLMQMEESPMGDPQKMIPVLQEEIRKAKDNELFLSRMAKEQQKQQ
jgi:hypothetical protein